MAKFQKGQPRPAGAGRKKNALPPDAKTTREQLTAFLSSKLSVEQLETMFSRLHTKDKLDILLKLLPYTLPRLQPLSIPDTTEQKPPFIINVLPVTHDDHGNPLT